MSSDRIAKLIADGAPALARRVLDLEMQAESLDGRLDLALRTSVLTDIEGVLRSQGWRP